MSLGIEVGVLADLIENDPEGARLESHLLCHSDCEGFYVPIEFEEVSSTTMGRFQGGRSDRRSWPKKNLSQSPLRLASGCKTKSWKMERRRESTVPCRFRSFRR